MQQPHTEGAIRHTDGEQDTGNHQASGTTRKVPGGVRAGVENVEKPLTNIEKGTAVDRAALEEQLDDSVSVNGPTERVAERDEHGRM